MGEPELLDPLRVAAQHRGVRSDLGLGEDDSDAHSRFNRVPTRFLPASPRRR
ncbi:hypothetical protein O982_10065 [Mycobacterium avium 10-5581]|nr:hypothetical protein O982_10065 [Mycobacterium avium 10-5581]